MLQELFQIICHLETFPDDTMGLMSWWWWWCMKSNVSIEQGFPHLSHESSSFSGLSVLPGRKVIWPGKLGSLVETGAYLVLQKTLLNRRPCRALGSGQLLVMGSWMTYNSANTEWITIKSVGRPVPSKLGLASTICAWWRHLRQWLRLPVWVVQLFHLTIV